ncbi:hypothetical protein DPMN_050728 [Dreissena polymorpha]|uniref:Uncharacterized protein n=1 Tax=Dreissena polymorpha TaxID=45954 RepID=A0A9D4HNA2_DREPO|nr:hypothetical protein DPMN_050728 [Dreissena polymorpha]
MFPVNPGQSIAPSPNGKHHTGQSTLRYFKDLTARLEDRAKTASAILGRRHYETSAILGRRHYEKDKQMMQREIVCGIKICPISSVLPIKTTDAISDCRCIKASCPVVSSSRISPERRRINQFRPKTAALYTHRNASSTDVRFLENSLKVLSLKPYKESNHNKCFMNPSYDYKKYELGTVNANAIECCKLGTETDYHHNAVTDMTSLRAKSAPPSGSPQYSTLFRKKINDKSLPVFWKTRERNFHRNKKHRSDHTWTSGRSNLLEMPETTRFSSGGCPYKCRSCFGAFFASEDYLQTLKTQINK